MLTLALLSFLLTSSIPSSLAGSPGAAERQREINRAHDAAIFPRDTPSLVDEMTDRAFLERFSKEECKIAPPSSGVVPEPKQLVECNARFKQALVNAFAAKYFAVNRKAIEERCRNEELVCMDPRILEVWVRESHNSEIELSRRQKLARLGRRR